MAEATKTPILRCAVRILPGYLAMVAVYLLYRFGFYPLFGKDWSFPLRHTMELCVVYGVGAGIFYLSVRRYPLQNAAIQQKRGEGGDDHRDFREKVRAWTCLLVIQSGLSVPLLVLVEMARTSIFHMEGTMVRPNVTFVSFYILYFLILRPVLEEMIFREIILRRIGDAGRFRASLFTALLSAFMVYLMDGISQACAMLLLAFMWSELYQRMEGRPHRLRVTIILHSFSNLWIVLLPWLLKSSRPGLVIYAVVWIVVVPMIAIDWIARLNRR